MDSDFTVECPNCQHTVQAHVDGLEMRRVADEQIDKALTGLAESFSRGDAGIAKTTLGSQGLLGPASAEGFQFGHRWGSNILNSTDEVL